MHLSTVNIEHEKSLIYDTLVWRALLLPQMQKNQFAAIFRRHIFSKADPEKYKRGLIICVRYLAGRAEKMLGSSTHFRMLGQKAPR